MGLRFYISNKFPGGAQAAGPGTTPSRKDLIHHPGVLLHVLDTIFAMTLPTAINRNPIKLE